MFDGETYNKKFDEARLKGYNAKVYDYMKNGGWFTLHELSYSLNMLEATVSARLRDLRKEKFGSHIVERRRVGCGGLHQYRLVPNVERIAA